MVLVGYRCRRSFSPRPTLPQTHPVVVVEDGQGSGPGSSLRFPKSLSYYPPPYPWHQTPSRVDYTSRRSQVVRECRESCVTWGRCLSGNNDSDTSRPLPSATVHRLHGSGSVEIGEGHRVVERPTVRTYRIQGTVP